MAKRIVGALLLVLLAGSLGYKLEQEFEMISDYPLAVVMIVLLLVLLAWGIRKVLRDY